MAKDVFAVSDVILWGEAREWARIGKKAWRAFYEDLGQPAGQLSPTQGLALSNAFRATYNWLRTRAHEERDGLMRMSHEEAKDSIHFVQAWDSKQAQHADLDSFNYVAHTLDTKHSRRIWRKEDLPQNAPYTAMALLIRADSAAHALDLYDRAIAAAEAGDNGPLDGRILSEESFA